MVVIGSVEQKIGKCRKSRKKVGICKGSPFLVISIGKFPSKSARIAENQKEMQNRGLDFISRVALTFFGLLPLKSGPTPGNVCSSCFSRGEVALVRGPLGASCPQTPWKEQVP